MKRFWMTAGLLAALSGFGLDGTFAQQRESKSNRGDRQNESSSSERERQNRDDRSTSRENREFEDNVRLRYDDERNRLNIDVDDEIQFRNDEDRSGRDRGWARDGEFDLRYDTDRQDLRASGEGTIDVDRAASNMARWWQSWWEEEKTARRSQQQGSQSGARLFVRQHDANDDDYLSRREVPHRHREEFDSVDRNGDDYLSLSEVRRYGDEMYQTAQRSSRDDSRSQASRRRSRQDHQTSQSNQDEQTWSQWWASWWSDRDDGNQSRDRIAADGAREFIRKHDENGDGFLVRSEMPERMYDDFDRLDSNGDRYLIRSEIEEHAQRTDRNSNRYEDRASRSYDSRR